MNEFQHVLGNIDFKIISRYDVMLTSLLFQVSQRYFQMLVVL